MEQELEEQREVERPGQSKAATPHFDERFKQLVLNGVLRSLIDCMKNEGVLQSIPQSLSHTQLIRLAEDDTEAWADHLLVTRDFKTVIISATPTCDDFLRPVWWIAQLQSTSGRNLLIIFSSYECNQLLPVFRQSKRATLFPYRPRLSKFHDNLLHKQELQVTGMLKKDRIDVEDEVQIGAYAGMMYFKSEVEMEAYCRFLGSTINLYYFKYISKNFRTI